MRDRFYTSATISFQINGRLLPTVRHNACSYHSREGNAGRSRGSLQKRDWKEIENEITSKSNPDGGSGWIAEHRIWRERVAGAGRLQGLVHARSRHPLAKFHDAGRQLYIHGRVVDAQ